MKAVKIVSISLISLATLVAAIFFLVGYLKPKPGGIKIDTTPSASVYINGSFVGKSPYHGTFPSGVISLKLVPESQNSNLVPFETNITFVSGIETVVSRNFGESEDLSSDSVISFERTGGTDASLVVISTPDNAQISIDGVSRGFAPYKVSAITPAMHQVTIKSPGYADSSATIQTLSGYRLTFFTKLQKESTTNQETESSPEAATQKQFVQVLDTPTGFLRVRTKPGAIGEEIAEVRPGEIYPYLDEDVASGWLEIQYQEVKAGLPNGITGWISGDYSKKVMLPADSTTSASIK